ncbi:MAG: hypothetical protein RL518_2183 [Pseudomonadota bacterium]|jgi:two-component system chemotaxis response regulator CheY
MVRTKREEPQVLVIDDVAATRAILRDMLVEMGFTDIEEAQDGAEALEKLKDHRAQLIICDNYMEGMGGLDLLYQLRNYAYLVDIPFIVVSLVGDAEMMDVARNLGADEYIVKPIHFNTFRQKVLGVLQRRAAQVG